MVTTGQHLQVIDVQTMANVSKPILNVWYFEVTAVTGSPVINNMAEELEDWVNAWLFTTLLPVQSQGVTHTQLIVNSVEDYETEFAVVNYGGTYVGLQSFEFTSSAVAWSVQLNRLFRTTRNGSKRFCGPSENLIVNNNATSAALGALDALCDAIPLVPPIDDGGPSEISLRLVIPKTPTPPATLPSVFNPVIAATYRGIGTQSSRKQLLS